MRWAVFSVHGQVAEFETEEEALDFGSAENEAAGKEVCWVYSVPRRSRCD